MWPTTWGVSIGSVTWVHSPSESLCMTWVHLTTSMVQRVLVVNCYSSTFIQCVLGQVHSYSPRHVCSGTLLASTAILYCTWEVIALRVNEMCVELCLFTYLPFSFYCLCSALTVNTNVLQAITCLVMQTRVQWGKCLTFYHLQIKFIVCNQASCDWQGSLTSEAATGLLNLSISL